jgi:hypothetical protein
MWLYSLKVGGVYPDLEEIGREGKKTIQLTALAGWALPDLVDTKNVAIEYTK